MPYDVMVVSAHPDDAEVQMGGTIAKLTDSGMWVLTVCFLMARTGSSPIRPPFVWQSRCSSGSSAHA